MGTGNYSMGNGNFTMGNGNFNVGTGNSTIGGPLHVGGNLSITGTTSFGGNIASNVTLASGQNLTVGGNSSVTGNSDINWKFNRYWQFNFRLTLNGNTSITGTHTLAVGGAETVGGTLSVTGAQTVGSTLTVTGAQSVGGALNVGGSSSLSGNAAVGGNLTVNGTTTPALANAGSSSTMVVTNEFTQGALASGPTWNGTTIAANISGTAGSNIELFWKSFRRCIRNAEYNNGSKTPGKKHRKHCTKQWAIPRFGIPRIINTSLELFLAWQALRVRKARLAHKVPREQLARKVRLAQPGRKVPLAQLAHRVRQAQPGRKVPLAQPAHKVPLAQIRATRFYGRDRAAILRARPGVEQAFWVQVQLAQPVRRVSTRRNWSDRPCWPFRSFN